MPSLEIYERQATDGRISQLPSLSLSSHLPEGRGQKVG